ncbi:MAG TPA: glycosyltransferase family 39 protein [Ktedonobacterales bacterium]
MAGAATMVTSVEVAPRRTRTLIQRASLRAWQPLLIGALALALDLFRLGGPSLWMDEAFSVQLARQPLSVLWGAFRSGAEPNMAIYYLILHLWLGLGAALGIPATEFYVRFPSAVCAAASAVMVYAIGRRFLGAFCGMLGALLYLLNGLVLTYAQQTRGYALQLLLVCLAWYALLALLDERTPRPAARWWALLVAASVLAVYTHAFSMLILLAQIVAVGALAAFDTATRACIRRMWLGQLASLAAIGVLIVPFAIASRHGAKNGWLPSPQIGELVAKATALGGKSKLALAVLAVALLAGLALLALARLPAGRRLLARLQPGLPADKAHSGDTPALRPGARPAVIALLCWLVVPVVVSFVLSEGPVRLFSSRYLVVVMPAVALLVAAAVAPLRPRPARLIVAAGLVCAALALVPSYYAHAQVEDWRTPTRWLEAHYAPGDGLVSYNNVQGCELPVAYYLQTDGSPAHFTLDSPGAVNLALYGSGDPFAHFGVALDPGALAAYAAHHPRLFFIEGRFSDGADAVRAHKAQAWLDAHYHFVAQTSSGIVTIRLYDIAAPLPA